MQASLPTRLLLTNNMPKQFLFILLLLSVACQHKSEKHTETVVSFENMRYSKLFGIAHFRSFSQLFFLDNGDTTWSLRSDQTTNNNIALMSSVFAGFFEVLNAQNAICAVDKIAYYSDSFLLSLYQQGKIIEIGEEGQLKMELLLKIKPALLIASSHTANDQSLIKRLNTCGTKLIPCDNFKEQHPLARAEWIKMFGFICGKYPQSVKFFQQLESDYTNLKNSVPAYATKPMVMTDAMYMSVWNVPGAGTYTAQLIEDAGGQYIFSDKTERYSYPLNFESVFNASQNATVWIHVNQFKSLQEMLQTEPRYALFKPFANRSVYNYNKRENAQGGNDFWETGVVRPDLVLHDLIQIFSINKNTHPNLYFYNRLD